MRTYRVTPAELRGLQLRGLTIRDSRGSLLDLSQVEEKKSSKYKNRGEWYEGTYFDSQAELREYVKVKMLEKLGIYKDVHVHTRYRLIKNEVLLCTYEDDHNYIDTRDGQRKVVDVKGYRTDEYKRKKKLMKELLGIDIIEIAV